MTNLTKIFYQTEFVPASRVRIVHTSDISSRKKSPVIAWTANGERVLETKETSRKFPYLILIV